MPFYFQSKLEVEEKITQFITKEASAIPAFFQKLDIYYVNKPKTKYKTKTGDNLISFVSQMYEGKNINQNLARDLIKFFVKKGVSINEHNLSGLTPLHIAILNNNLNTAKMLVDYGAKISVRTRNRRFNNLDAIQLVETLINMNYKEMNRVDMRDYLLEVRRKNL